MIRFPQSFKKFKLCLFGFGVMGESDALVLPSLYGFCLSKPSFLYGSNIWKEKRQAVLIKLCKDRKINPIFLSQQGFKWI